MTDTGSEVFLVNDGGLPGEGSGRRIVAGEEDIDAGPDLLGRGVASAEVVEIPVSIGV
jgi:hypothetical protein